MIAVPADPEQLHWKTVVYAKTPKHIFVVHRCKEEPRITWHFVQKEDEIGEKFAVDCLDMTKWDPERIADRLKVVQPFVVMTKEELDMDRLLADPVGHA